MNYLVLSFFSFLCRETGDRSGQLDLSRSSFSLMRLFGVLQFDLIHTSPSVVLSEGCVCV